MVVNGYELDVYSGLIDRLPAAAQMRREAAAQHYAEHPADWSFDPRSEPDRAGEIVRMATAKIAANRL